MSEKPPLESSKEATFQADWKSLGKKIRNNDSVPPLVYGQKFTLGGVLTFSENQHLKDIQCPNYGKL